MSQQMKLSVLLEMLGAKATKAELDSVRMSVGELTGSTVDLGKKTAPTAVAVTALGDAADRAAADATDLAASQRIAAQTAGAMGRSHQMAASQVGNLTAQFNDIGMMMMAGQNPLQLAVQQGTQITQVIGPMGAAGAVKALGAGFLSMLNPMNLVVIGSIAVGAAMVQWLTGAGEDVVTLDDQISALEQATRDYGQAADLAGASTDDLAARFGSAAEKGGQVADVLSEFARIDAVRALDDAVGGLTETFGGLSIEVQGAARSGPMGSEYQRTFATIKNTFDLTDQSAQALLEGFRSLANAPTVKAQVDAAIALNDEFIRVFGSIENIPPELYQVAKQAALIALSASEISGEMDKAEASVMGLSGAAQLVQGRILGAKTAMDLLAAAEPDGGWLAGAITAAGDLAARLWSAVQANSTFAASTPAAMGPAGAPAGVTIPPPVLPSGMPTPPNRPFELGIPDPPPVGGGGSSGAGVAQQDAAQDLIDSLQQELDLLKETDPVQQEMLRHREDLAHATEAQRAEVEALITATKAEEAAAEAVADRWKYMGDTAYDALHAIAMEGESANDVLRNLGAQLADVVFQAAIMGTGPLGSVFGGSSIFDMLLPAKAEGGMIYGPGSGTSDDVLMWGSSGEFMVRAAATARYRPLLEAMNSGAPLPAFASGGMIGGTNAGTAAAAAAGNTIHMSFDLTGARGNREIEELVGRAFQEGMAQYDRLVLPLSVSRIANDQRRIG
jgi:hypothetical protein